MAEYTTQVRSICEQAAGLDDHAETLANVETVIQTARASIFYLDYPIYTGGNKAALEAKILRRYWMREIAFETVGRWKMALNTRLLEIMPYYVDLWRNNVNSLSFDGDVDLIREITEEITGSGENGGTITTSGTGTTTHGMATTRTGSEQRTRQGSSTRVPSIVTKDKFSDTPQGGISQVDNDGYLTEYRNVSTTGEEVTTDGGQDTTTYQSVKDQQSGTTGRTDSGSRTEAFTSEDTKNRETVEHTHGKQNALNYVELRAKLMSMVINIDNMIIDNLADLFFNLY